MRSNTIKVYEKQLIVSVLQGQEIKQFENSFDKFNILLSYLGKHSKGKDDKFTIIVEKKCKSHSELIRYLLISGIEFELKIGQDCKDKIKSYTENLDLKTLKNRLSSINEIIKREQLRLNDVKEKNSSSIISMIINSINSYRQKRARIESIINNR